MTDANGYAVLLGDRGRLVLPASLRRQLRLQNGDRLLRARQLRGLVRDLAPSRSSPDEMLAERRSEAREE